MEEVANNTSSQQLLQGLKELVYKSQKSLVKHLSHRSTGELCLPPVFGNANGYYHTQGCCFYHLCQMASNVLQITIS